MNSDQVKTGFQRAPHRSLFMATGVKRDDFKKPFIGVCNSYTDIIPGHCHLNKVAEWGVNIWNKAKEAISNFWNAIVEKISALPSEFWNWLCNVITKVATWVVNMQTKANEAIACFAF